MEANTIPQHIGQTKGQTDGADLVVAVLVELDQETRARCWTLSEGSAICESRCWKPGQREILSTDNSEATQVSGLRVPVGSPLTKLSGAAGDEVCPYDINPCALLPKDCRLESVAWWHLEAVRRSRLGK